MFKLIKNLFIPNKNNNFIAWLFHERALILYILIAITLKLCFICFEVYFPQSQLFATIVSNDVVSLVNQERIKNKLPALVLDEKLNQAAQFKATDMIANQYFSHTSPSGVTPWHWFKKAGYNFKIAGENLAIHFTDSKDLISAWMQSPSHRDNILNSKFSEVGLAVKSGEINGRQTTLCVLIFGTKEEFSPRQQPRKNQQKEPQKLYLNTTPKTTTKEKEGVILQIASPEEKTLRQESSRESTERLVLVEIKKSEKTIKAKSNNKILLQPRVLGAFVSKTDELVKSLYVYFSTFLLMALVLNILVRINIQDISSIVLALLLLILNIGLLYV